MLVTGIDGFTDRNRTTDHVAVDLPPPDAQFPKLMQSPGGESASNTEAYMGCTAMVFCAGVYIWVRAKEGLCA
jgi:hypothetical protein